MAAAASGSSPVVTAPTASVPTFPEGASVPLDGLKLEVSAVRRCRPPAEFEPAPGLEQLGVRLSLEGTEDLPTRFLPMSSVRLIDGRNGSHAPVLGGCDPMLRTVAVNKEEKARGWLTFEVPRGASGFILEVTVPQGAAQQKVRLALRR